MLKECLIFLLQENPAEKKPQYIQYFFTYSEAYIMTSSYSYWKLNH